MNKQIIIDGVDIKDCKRRIGKDNFCRYYKRPCAENNYNCIWKKYLRKEQELQEAMDNYVQLDLQRVKEYNELVDLYKAKEQECEALRMSENEAREIIAELKAENDTLRQFLSKEPLALQALQSAYSSYKKSADVFYEMVKQYKKTLTEIKDYCNKYPQNSIGFKKYILQKINDCEENNDMENN